MATEFILGLCGHTISFIDDFFGLLQHTFGMSPNFPQTLHSTLTNTASVGNMVASTIITCKTFGSTIL